MRELLLSFGIFLGIVHTQPDPTLAARIYRDPTALSLNLEVGNVLSEEAQAVLRAGNSMELVIEIQIGNEVPKTVRHRITCDPLSMQYRIERDEENRIRHQTDSSAAALSIFGTFYGLHLKELDQAEFPMKIFVQAHLRLPDRPSLDAGILWNYKKLGVAFDLRSIYEIPH